MDMRLPSEEALNNCGSPPLKKLFTKIIINGLDEGITRYADNIRNKEIKLRNFRKTIIGVNYRENRVELIQVFDRQIRTTEGDIIRLKNKKLELKKLKEIYDIYLKSREWVDDNKDQILSVSNPGGNSSSSANGIKDRIFDQKTFYVYRDMRFRTIMSSYISFLQDLKGRSLTEEERNGVFEVF